MDFVIMDLLLILAQKKYLTMKYQVAMHLDLPIMTWVLSDVLKRETKWAELSIVT